MVGNLLRAVVALLLACMVVAGAVAAEGDATSDAAGDAAGGSEAEQSTEKAGETLSLPRRIARFTQESAEAAVGQFERALGAISALGENQVSVDWGSLSYAMARLALVAAAAFAIFALLRWLARAAFSRASQWAVKGDASFAIIRRVIALIAAAFVDALVVVLAWIGGYAVALFALGGSGSMATEQSLFLNAFLVVELFKLFVRMVFASKDDGLRLLPLPSADAAYWNIRIAFLAGFIGYGLLLAKPIVDGSVTPALGSVLAPVIKLLGFVYAAVMITRNRYIVRDKLLKRASVLGGAQWIIVAIVGRSWHALAIIYLAGLTLASMVSPAIALPFMIKAMLQTVIAIAAGVFVSEMLGQLMQRPIWLPETTRAKLPLLERRINGFVPKVLRLVRVFIGIVVTAVVIDAWRFVFDLRDWLASEAGAAVLGTTLSVAFIIIGATSLWLVFVSWIEHRLNPNAGRGEPGAREKTLLSLFHSAGTIAIVTLTGMVLLSELGVAIGPLLAGAGVVGLAIGFGAQQLVQDVITGVFIQFENSINTGDFITVAGISGAVERLSIRSVGLRDLSGTLHLVPFSAVDTVSNYMREFAYHLGVYSVALKEDVDNVIKHLDAAFEELKQDPAEATKLLGPLEVDGLTEFADSAVNIRIRIMTTPGDQWSVGRAYNRLVKKHFDAAGVEIPFPHRMVYFGASGQEALEGPQRRAVPTGDDQPAPEPTSGDN